MSELLKTALVGTARQSPPQIDTSHPVDRLEPQEQTTTEESRFLLRWGRRAVYSRAGQRADSVPPIEPAPNAASVTWSKRFVVQVNAIIQSGNQDLLRDLLNLFAEIELPFPTALAADLLSFKKSDLRPLISNVVGEHGRWLSQFNPDWSWVNAPDVSEKLDLNQLEIVWHEGVISDRCLALREVRERDPLLGRTWLESGFKKEKADHRAKLIAELSVGLNPDDIEFLTQALRDRSKFVKENAAKLLSRIPASEVAQRYQERAQSLLVVDDHQSGRLKLSVHPPQVLPKDWEEDGISAKPGGRAGKRASWAEELIARIDIRFWDTQFEATPTILINGVLNDDFAHSAITGWTRAVLDAVDSSPTEQWHDPLWKYWSAMTQHAQNHVKEQAMSMLSQLAEKLPPEQLERSLLTLIQSQPDPTNVPVEELLKLLHRPWSKSFAKEFLRLSRSLAGSRSDRAVYYWLGSLQFAATAIPASLFDEALSPWKLRDHGVQSWQLSGVQKLVDQFTQLIQIRKLLYEEIEEHRPSSN